MTDNVMPLIPDEAIAAVTAAAFTIRSDDPDDPQQTRRVVHSFRGPFGADWDLSSVVSCIRASRSLHWQPIGPFASTHPLLVVEADGRKIRFEAKR